jgi:hypothetical protein
MKRIIPLLFGAALFAVYLSGCGSGSSGSSSSSSSSGSSSGDNTHTSPPQPVDISKPAINSTTPAHNSVAVCTNSAITVSFNKPIYPAAINTQTFILLKDGTIPVTGNVTSVGTTAQFSPAGSLSPGTSYSAIVTTGVKDLAGNAMAASYTWQFTTGDSPDSTAPLVLATYPASHSVGVSLNSAVTVTFNEAIDPATINAQTFILLEDGTIPVAGSVTNVGTTVQFRPSSNLSAGASYSAVVTTGVKDLAGNALAANLTWGFTTGSVSDSDTVGPHVLSVSPPDGSIDVPVDSPIVITFDEPIMPFEFGLIDGRPVAVTFNDTYTTVTMKPAVAMNSGTTFTSSIRIKDMAGNLMSAIFRWQFSTRL